MQRVLGIKGGFALPTVIIASVVMLGVLASSLAAVTSTRSAVQTQQYAQLARDAAQSGVEMANACRAAGTDTWANPLRPGSACTGAASQCTAANCYLISTSDYRTTFEVETPYAPGDTSIIVVHGYVERLRESTGTPWRTYTQKMTISSGTGSSEPEVRTLSWKQVSVGESSICAIASDNWAYCWGSNANNRLGDGTSTDRQTPTPIARGAIPAGATIQQIAATGAHACAIASDNKMYCWGYNGNGQLGDNSTTSRSTPVAVAQGAMPSGALVKSMAVASSHTCAVATANLRAYCWGSNSNGRLGDASTTQRTTPVAVAQGAMPAGWQIESIATDTSHTCATTIAFRAYCWGLNSDGQLGDNSTTQRTSPVAVTQGQLSGTGQVIQLAVGSSFTCASDILGFVDCWGLGSNGRLGQNNTTSYSTPQYIELGSIPGNSRLQTLAAGRYGACTSEAFGNIYCWGQNSQGQVGDNTTTDRWAPVQVNFSGVAGGYANFTDRIDSANGNTCAISLSNKLYCWGDNNAGQLADGTTTDRPTPVEIAAPLDGSTKISLTGTISMGSVDHACAIGTDDWVYCWGNNAYGQLGDGTTTQRNSPVPIAQGAIPDEANLRDVTTGREHTCATDDDGRVYCWGRNNYGQLGNNTTTNSSVAVEVSEGAIPGNIGALKVVATFESNCILASDSIVYCWGRNNYGQLGDNSTTQRNTPVAVPAGQSTAGSLALTLSGGYYHYCITDSDTMAYCWGYNGYGQLGDGTTTNRSTLRLVQTGGSAVRQITTGYYHTCGVMQDGVAYCMGRNNVGQLGDGTTTTPATSVAVVQGDRPAGSYFTSIIAGESYTCGIVTNARPYCWGVNTHSVLGDGTTTTRSSPRAVSQGALPTGLMVSRIDTGIYSTCAVSTVGIPYCWGQNSFGQVGINSTTTQTTPAAVIQTGMPDWPLPPEPTPAGTIRF